MFANQRNPHTRRFVQTHYYTYQNINGQEREREMRFTSDGNQGRYYERVYPNGKVIDRPLTTTELIKFEKKWTSEEPSLCLIL